MNIYIYIHIYLSLYIYIYIYIYKYVFIKQEYNLQRYNHTNSQYMHTDSTNIAKCRPNALLAMFLLQISGEFAVYQWGPQGSG